MNVFRCGRRLRRRDRGASQVEFAVSILVVMFIVFWTWELLMAVYSYSVLCDAAKEGVRYAIVHGTRSANCSGPSCTSGDTAGDNVCNVVRDYAQYSLHYVPGGTGSGCTGSFTTSCSPSTNGVYICYLDNSSDPINLPRVQVVVSYHYVPYINLPITPLLSANAQGRIVH